MSRSRLLSAATLAFALAVANTAAAWTAEHSRDPASKMLHKASLPDLAGESVEIPSRNKGNSFGETGFGRKYMQGEKDSEGSVFQSLDTVLEKNGSFAESAEDYRQLMIDIEKEKRNKANAIWQPTNNSMVKDYLEELPDYLPGVDASTMEEVVRKTEWEMFLNNKFRDMAEVDAFSDDHSRTVYGETGAMFVNMLGRIDSGLKQVAENVTGPLVEKMVDRRHDGFLVDGFLLGMRSELPGLDAIRMDRTVRITGEQMVLANSLARTNNPDLSDRVILEKTADTFVDCLAETEVYSGIIARVKAIASEMIERMLDGYDPLMDMDMDFGEKSIPFHMAVASAEEFILIEDSFPESGPVNIPVADLIGNPFEKPAQPEVSAGTHENTIEI